MPKDKRSLKKQKKSRFTFPTLNLPAKQKDKAVVLLSLISLLIGVSLFNSYISLKFPKQDFSKIKNTSISSQNSQTGPIRISTDLMKAENASQPPARIIIPKSNIDLNVNEANIKNGFWEVSETNASHGVGSANPGAKGNQVIFAHARVGLFYNLKDVKNGDIIYVLTDSRWFAYKVNKITSVYPDQVEVIMPTKDETLTLYTCTGYADEKRLIVIANPVK